MAARFGGTFVDGSGNAVTNPTAVLEPDLSAVTGFDIKYWTLTGDVVTLMNQTDRDDVDVDEVEADKDLLEADFGDDPFAETVRELINVERAARGASALTPAQYRANYRSNL